MHKKGGVCIKSLELILKRAIVLLAFSDRCCLEFKVVNGKSYSLEEREKQRQLIYKWLQKSGYYNYLTNEEQDVFDTEIKSGMINKIALMENKYECIEPLLWAIGLVKKLTSYDKYVITDFHPLLEIGVEHNFDRLIKKCVLKSEDEIVKQREISMLWHWRARTGRYPKLSEQNIDEKIISLFGSSIVECLKEIKLTNKPVKDFIAFNKRYNILTDNEIAKLEQISLWRHHAFEWIICEDEWDGVDLST